MKKHNRTVLNFVTVSVTKKTFLKLFENFLIFIGKLIKFDYDFIIAVGNIKLLPPSRLINHQKRILSRNSLGKVKQCKHV